MKKLFRIDESEKKRILSMHTNATSRQYLSEQEVTPEDKTLLGTIDVAVKGAGTNVSKLKDVFGKITDLSQFKRINDNMSKYTPYDSIQEMLKDEMGLNNYEDMQEIAQALGKIGVDVSFRSSSMAGQIVGVKSDSIKVTVIEKIDENLKQFYDKWPCLKDDSYTDVSVMKHNGVDYMKFKTENTFYAVKFDDGFIYMWDGQRWNKSNIKAACAGSSVEGLNEGLMNLPNQQGGQQEPTQQQPTQQQPTQQQPTQQQGGNRTRSGSSGLLKRGSNSEEVVTAKMKINKALPNVIEDLQINTSDPNFNDKTVAAVAYFQAKNGLKVDGIIGPKTRGELNKITLDNPQQGGEQQVQQNNPTAGEGTA